MLPGTQRDDVVISRPVTGADSEGNPIGGTDAVATVQGGWGSVSSREADQATQRGEIVDAAAIIPNGTDVRVGDVVSVRSHTWVVVGVKDVQVHQRVLLRENA